MALSDVKPSYISYRVTSVTGSHARLLPCKRCKQVSHSAGRRSRNSGAHAHAEAVAFFVERFAHCGRSAACGSTDTGTALLKQKSEHAQPCKQVRPRAPTLVPTKLCLPHPPA